MRVFYLRKEKYNFTENINSAKKLKEQKIYKKNCCFQSEQKHEKKQ